MAHNLSRESGRVEMFYSGDKEPWHKLGVRLGGLATSAEAMAAAGLDWNVEKRPVLYRDPAGTIRESSKFEAVVRTDTERDLGVVGKAFVPLQNREAFSFFDAIVGEKAAMYETAGALGNGERIWLLAKLPGTVVIGGDDTIEKYLLLAHAHDGSLAVWLMRTGVRVVCQNTLSMALGGARGGRDKSIALRHSARLGTRLEEVRETLGIVSAQFEAMAEAGRRLAAVQLTSEALAAYSRKVFVPNPDEEVGPKTAKMLDEVVRLFETGKGSDLPTARGTAWGAFNAVVEFVDYSRKSRKTANGTEADNRTDSILFGVGARLKQRAWDEALALAK